MAGTATRRYTVADILAGDRHRDEGDHVNRAGNVDRENARFAFGANWQRFLALVDAERISLAEESLKEAFGVERLDGQSFLDAGSGSGLFSLAARRLGARVHSFDLDPQSVACTAQLRSHFFSDDREWTVEHGSLLDREYLQKLGTFDYVYSWGVLHHTGAMWLALENVLCAVRPGGTLMIAVYNDQGWKSHFWWFIKLGYTRLPEPVKPVYAYSLGAAANALNILKYTIKLTPMVAIRPLLQRRKRRGMSVSHDLVDWIGGFPYEYAGYDVMTRYMTARGFQLIQGKRARSAGLHEMVYRSSGR